MALGSFFDSKSVGFYSISVADEHSEKMRLIIPKISLKENIKTAGKQQINSQIKIKSFEYYYER